MRKDFRIVAIAQVFNELRRGNLRRFVAHLKPLVDELVVYDNGSTDGSWQYLQSVTPHLLRGPRNDFLNERSIRQQLLHFAMDLRPDFILWLDADEVLTANASAELQHAAQLCIERDADGIALHELNLWRSQSWRRIDNAYDDGWFVRMWRATPHLRFDSISPGLHQQLYPESISRVIRHESLAVLHYGFSTDDQILFKYLNYRRYGQSGWALERLIDESTLSLQHVAASRFPPQLRFNDPKPLARPRNWWMDQAAKKADALLPPSVTVVSLIFRSTKWLRFSYEHILRYADLSGTEVLFVANDATDNVLTYLRNNYIPHIVHVNTPEQQQDHYINNVYRAWNSGAQAAKGEFLLFVNSDMAFTPAWIEKLLQRFDGRNCVAARLVESGKMPSGKYGISQHFGRTIEDYDHAAFLRYAASIASPEIHDGGLFMPLLIRKSDFLAVGGFPEGNVVPGTDYFAPTIARPDEPSVSGDVVLMNKLEQRGIRHQTDFNTISYHFQEGELDEGLDRTSRPVPVKVVVVNDWLRGRMGERTMWNVLVENLPSTLGLDKATVGDGRGFERRVRQAFPRNTSPVVIQNATYIDLVDSRLPTIAVLQDDLRRMNRRSSQQERNLRLAHVCVTNSLLTAYSYPEYNFEVIPLGTDENLFRPIDKGIARAELKLQNDKPIAIFVGDLSPVKGWGDVRTLVERREDIHWIIVSKKDEYFQAPNVTMRSRVEQSTLARLYNAADVFILGSPVETQCLAAIEAGFCDVPIVMHNTGIFWGLDDATKNSIGWFGHELEVGLEHVLADLKRYSPRAALLAAELTNADMVRRWHSLLERVRTRVDKEWVVQQSEPRPPKWRRILIKPVKHAMSRVYGGAIAAVKRTLPDRLVARLAAFRQDVRRGIRSYRR